MYGSAKRRRTPLRWHGEQPSPVQEVWLAWEEWQLAEEFLREVTDPALVDYGIYRLKAAETRYRYLLQTAATWTIKTQPLFLGAVDRVR